MAKHHLEAAKGLLGSLKELPGKWRLAGMKKHMAPPAHEGAPELPPEEKTPAGKEGPSDEELAEFRKGMMGGKSC